MRVHDHRSGGFEHVAEYQVCGLAPHAGQLEQLFHRAGHLAAVLYEQYLGALDYVPRLGVVEAAGLDVLLYLGHIRLGKGLQRGETLKERRGYLVHALVRALRGQADGEQQLIVLAVVERAHRGGVFFFETADDLQNLFRRSQSHHQPCFFVILTRNAPLFNA